MSNSNISVKTISDLLQYNFFIPSYQRGYRWTEQQVTDLLNDVWEFINKPNKNDDEYYCLQPVVVRKNEGNDKLEVIDGQQRLTTIYLILKYLKQNPFEIEYETRNTEYHNSKNFLQEINSKEADKKPNNNIDFYHIDQAYQAIKKWFNEELEKQKSFSDKLLEKVKIIWYETTDVNSINIFTRINSGKIPLTNAELIKALFLNSSNFENKDLEKLRLKQLEIASEWDRIEYALQDNSLWYFINKNENNLATRIEFIFNLMAEKEPTHDDYFTFRFFIEKFKNKKENEINENWQEIKKYFQTLEEWYNDRELYHKIGYLIAIGINIKNILTAKKEKSKTDFLNWIKQEIESKFKNMNLEEVEYNGAYVREILLLHNIQTMLNNQNETNRFPFDRFKKEYWDVEHIHAIATEVKVKKENQVQWLKNNFIETPNHQDEIKNNQIEQIIKSGDSIDETDFDSIINYVLGEEDNSLQNLCLLDRGTNRSYKNDSFKLKRKKIIERETGGTFIPICSKNVFMKYYSTNVKDLEIWNESDRASYFEKIQTVISQYLPKLNQ